jgi:hypothetical protein
VSGTSYGKLRASHRWEVPERYNRRNEEASEETFGGDWFHTKDAAVQDEAQSSVPRGAIHSIGWCVARATASKWRS